MTDSSTDVHEPGRPPGPRPRPSGTLRTTWPFIVLVPLVLAVAGLGLLVQNTGQVIFENGQRWERAQMHAVMALSRYATSCAPADYQRYLQERAVLRHFEQARRAMFGPRSDHTAAQRAYEAAGVPAWEARLLRAVLPALEHTAANQSTSEIFEAVSAIAYEIDRGAQVLHAQAQDCRDPAARQATMAAVDAVEERFHPLQARFEHMARQARWRLGALVLAGMALLALPLTLAGQWLSARLQHGALQAAAHLARSERRLRQALSGSGHGVWEVGPESGRIHCSAGMMTILGHPADARSFTRDEFENLLSVEDRQALWPLLRERARDGQPFECEFRMFATDGSQRWFRLAGQRQAGEGAAATAIVGSVLDVTERRQLQRALEAELDLRRQALRALHGSLARLQHSTLPRAADTTSPTALAAAEIEEVERAMNAVAERLQLSNARLQAVLDLSPDAFVSMDQDGIVGLVSPAAMTLAGLDAASLVGHHVQTLLDRLGERCHSADGRLALRNLEHLRRQLSEGPVSIELNGWPRRALALGVRESDDPDVATVLYLRDISQQRAVERLKTEFITLAAHELRTPMTSIFGYVELLRHRRLGTESQQALHDVIHQQCQVMIGIVDDVMGLMSLESERDGGGARESLTLLEVTRGALETLTVPTDREAPELPLPEQWPAEPVWGDRRRLVRALSKLLHNAYKYSPNGGPVQIALSRRIGPGGDPELGLSVADRGIGMTREQLTHAGERFYRADSSGHIPGTGLGLAFVFETIRQHQGRVDLDSVAGQGTRVTLWLPTQAAARAAAAPSPIASSSLSPASA